MSSPVNFNTLLRQINAIRVACNDEPIPAILPGIQEKMDRCPVALSLKNDIIPEVDRHQITLTVSGGTKERATRSKEILGNLRNAGFKAVLREKDYPEDGVNLTPTITMKNFIKRFDNGDFEELILNDRHYFG